MDLCPAELSDSRLTAAGFKEGGYPPQDLSAAVNHLPASQPVVLANQRRSHECRRLWVSVKF